MWLVITNSFSKFTHQAEFFDQSHACTLSFCFLHNRPISSKIVHKVVNRQKFLNLFSVPAVLTCNIEAGNSISDANLVLTIKAPISVTWFDFSCRWCLKIKNAIIAATFTVRTVYCVLRSSAFLFKDFSKVSTSGGKKPALRQTFTL